MKRLPAATRTRGLVCLSVFRSSKELTSVGHCSQAVLITCLHLAHETASRDVGMYAWTMPMIKDPAGSTMRIMKREPRWEDLN